MRMTDGWMDGGVQSRPGSCGAIAIRHLRIFTRGHELNSMGKTHESDGADGGRSGEVYPNEGRKGGSNHLLLFVVGPTFAHLSSSLRIRIDNDRRNDRPTGRTHQPGAGPRPTGIWAYAMEGGGMNGADADDGGVKIC